MKRLSSLRVRLVGIVFLAVAPALVLLLCTGLSSIGFIVGLLALAAAWVGGELFILRQIKALREAIKSLASGKLNTRSGLATEPTELGELARNFNLLAENLEQQTVDRERNEKSLLSRAHQQTVVAALGQFAIVASDLTSLLNQIVLLISQTLEIEFCSILELRPESNTFLLRAGGGWKEGYVNVTTEDTGHASQSGFTLISGEPVVVRNLSSETRFYAHQHLLDHGVVSGVTVAIQGHSKPFGVLGVHTSYERVFDEDEVHFLLSVANLLGMAIERQRTEPEIQKLAAFAKHNPNPVLEFSSEGMLTFHNKAAEKISKLLGQEHPETILPPNVAGIVQTCLATGQARLQLETRPANRVLSWSFYPIMPSQVVHCYVEDITDRLTLEEQFRQAQKMESVGQLAAGVAHDFNNILTIIQGHSGLLMSRANLAPAMITSIQAISFASERATSLTRQLLMFSRKEVIQPKQLDLKSVVDNMSKMLQRLLGETIAFKCTSSPNLPTVLGDTGMMEQILMNLAVNARDAMTKGGTLSVSTGPISVSLDYVKVHPDARTGLFVCLQVQDTGCGMDAPTMKRIFEPFFTTKEAGKGTGLGLATVYGIVKQHSGWIEVNSHLGKGTTFKIFFPATQKVVETPAATTVVTDGELRGGYETILVVEDEPVLRDLAQLILQDCGYKVIEASSGVEALTIWQQHQGNIDLLLTDMIMPDGLSGKDLAKSLLLHKPQLKVIFSSGYSVDDIGIEPNLKEGPRFLQKPYSRTTLAKAVRESLDS
ncbi:ATP-binding protein [Pedosphaera parvula]|uniref:histidine kinase n=1 Tax=Pedosphaera parvula (strain Ellin514) TaxID=320771 RepID=B9XN54_PEDPL|nr:ATP-binding protein [Pedosphaera parvula]EEF58716.1 multi-sensor hybrid histidine kinase [Pedosphaera parvula Ellin514]